MTSSAVGGKPDMAVCTADIRKVAPFRDIVVKGYDGLF
jgi:hypothetical protein